MARQHVTFAVALTGTGLATAAYAAPAVETWVRDRPFETGLFLLLIAGGALVPDIDHHGSTLTKKLGWLGAILHWTLRIFGIRHRGFMHTLWFALVSGAFFFALTLASALTEWVDIFLIVLLLFYASITLGFVLGKVGRNPALVLLLGVGMCYAGMDGLVDFSAAWVPVGAFLGPLLHDLGDMATKGKLPFLYPLVKTRFGSPIPFRTGGWFEKGLLRFLFFAWSLATVVWVVMMGSGNLERTDFAAWDGLNPTRESLPYVTWSVVP